MGKKWRQWDPDNDYKACKFVGDDVRYNAVEYDYPEHLPGKKYKHWEPKNTDKFKAMLLKNRKMAEAAKKETVDSEEIDEVKTNDESQIDDKCYKKLKKKKKNKEKEIVVEIEESEIINTNDDLETKTKKEKKKKKNKFAVDKTESDLHPENPVTNGSPGIDCEGSGKTKRKKKGKSDVFLDCPNEVTETLCSMSSNEKIGKKYKKKTSENKNCTEEIPKKGKKRKVVDDIVEEITEVKIKKKKRKGKSKTCNEDLSTLSPCKNINIMDAEDEDVPRKKKKKSKSKDETVNAIKTDVNCELKKTKKKEVVETSEAPADKTIIEVISTKKSKKKSKESERKETNEVVNVVVTKKKSKNKKKQTDDFVVNCSENKQEKLDNQKNMMGQWSTASFDDDKKKDKFMRLIGGAKASNMNTRSSRSGNMALTADKEAQLKNKLEKQYNDAMNILMVKGKGSGFGFQKDPAEGKKFHIDTNKSNSVKFDD